ncbi:MAG: peptidylprolyl isomerase [Bacteroidota bacterium]
MSLLRVPVRLALVAGLLVAALAGLAACERTVVPESYVARVGDRYLSEDELAVAMQAWPTGLDSLAARMQVIDQWVTGELLARAARAADLADKPRVERRLQDSERAVLADAYIEALYDERQPALDDSEVQTYFEANQERLRLREPYVRVRYLRFASESEAQTARAALVQAVRSATPDSLWRRVAETYAATPATAIGLSEAYFPESQLRQRLPDVGAVFRQYAPSQIAPVLELGDQYHVFQVVDRADAGTLPELGWIEEDLRRQMLIDARRQLISREVQALKSEAQASGALDLPN